MPPRSEPRQSERGYTPGTAWWRCVEDGNEWSGAAREYPPETKHDVHMVAAEGRADDCPTCGTESSDVIDFEPTR